MTEMNKPLCGFLNVLKPPGMSSAHVVGAVRRMLDGAKIGHAGTLDPEAAGVLPLMVGKAARLFDYMQDKEKAYVTEVAFGTATDTQDAQGVVIARGDHFPDEEAIRAAIPHFTGVIMQTPPMYSALKQDGKRLYEDITYGDSHGHTFIAMVDGTYIYQHAGKAVLCGEAYAIQNGAIRQICAKEQTLELG